MASARDVQDIMGMGGAVQKPAPKKKKKLVETQPRLSGMSREVQALMGDSVPPVQIVETPKYKSKPTLASKLFKPRHWEQVPFVHGAREDGLELKHWKRAIPSTRPPQSNGDTEMTDENSLPAYQYEDEFPMEKWNIEIRVPTYTDEQYERYFKSEDWSREETDYLMDLVSDYHSRWILISDRYEAKEIPHAPKGDADEMEIQKEYPARTMEQLKLRYYEIAAQDLESRIPKTNMTQAEFQLWEKMRNFDAKTETLRKATAEKLFERSKEDAEEERTLLEELHRITKHEEEFIAMRKDLYARLEAAPSLRRNERGEEQNIVLSSAGLSDLLNRLFNKERAHKRRVLPNGEPVSAQPSNEPKGRQPNQVHRRDTLETPTAEKKGSISQPVVKQLSKADEEKYGVTHAAPGERLTSGVSFRHEKINRVTTAKSQVQTQKINAALTELEIPARLSMPTEKVCKEFERLVGQIQLLLDARKTLTRVSEEIKTLEEMRRQRLGEPALQEVKNDTTGKNEPTNTATSQTQLSSNGPVQDESQENDTKDEGEPGPAVHEDDEEDEEDEADNDVSNVDQTQVEDEDEEEEEEEDEDAVVNESAVQKDDADDDDEEAEEEGENEDDEDEEAEADEDEDEGTAALRRGAENDDEEEEEEEEEDDEDAEREPLVEEGDEDEEEEDEEEDDADAEPTQNGGESDEDQEEEVEETQEVNGNTAADDDDDDDDEEDEEEPEERSSRPTSSGGHKRGASMVSDASGDGSNRSGMSRKKKR